MDVIAGSIAGCPNLCRAEYSQACRVGYMDWKCSNVMPSIQLPSSPQLPSRPSISLISPSLLLRQTIHWKCQQCIAIDSASVVATASFATVDLTARVPIAANSFASIKRFASALLVTYCLQLDWTPSRQ